MTEEKESSRHDPKDSALNKQMSPITGGALLGLIAFGFILYRSHDFIRALIVGVVVCIGIFGVMWAGQYLERRNKKKSDS
ncbi:hypothetical protein [Gimesia aquarii]|uniref:Uncharacterized protein n=1 Tax=Gimesia aquarii TaxID=2527964 RepID=A0A517W1V7_9PLAN|nr:hypothetical protein [Gimesia aquarii]QDT99255.1 hypothetical protein V144x_47660 [Gimesia aquarii]